MKLLHVLPSLDPARGGPLEGVRQRGVRLLAMGHSVEVVTLDDPAESFLAEFPLAVHALGPSRGGYRMNGRLVPWLKMNHGHYDAIIVNGIWQYHSYGTWRALSTLGIRYFVFTHGMLDPWVKSAYPLKHLKKWLYWPWADYRVLRDAKAVLFTSEEERQLARQTFWLYRAKEEVVSYGTAIPPTDHGQFTEQFLSQYPQLREKRIVLFMGRIHEKKGCDILIKAFAKVAAIDPMLELVIAGPDQTGWTSELKKLALKLDISNRITWPGMIRGGTKWGAFYYAEVFILPSHQENFGIVIAEALGCALPVLISDKVNIWREIVADRAGLVEPDTLAGTTRLLHRWLEMSPDAQKEMRIQARQSFDERFTVDAMADSLLAVVAKQ